MNINIKTIPQIEQRYATAGDYWWDKDGSLQIRVSELGNEDMEYLVAIHELTESYICEKRGIKETDIMAFDIAHSDSDDPGTLLDAPYYKEHLFASAIEMLIAEQLNINWQEYDNEILKLFENKEE